jgi:hypothetical protein
MCKFEDEDREGYKNIAQRLIRWISQLDRESREPAETQNYSVRMGDVNFRDKIDNNRGVITGHVYSTATEGVSISGTNITYHSTPPEYSN